MERDYNIEAVNDSLSKVGKVASKAANSLEALCDVLKVDPEELKRALLMRALRDAADGKIVNYEGNFWKDILDLVEGLEKKVSGLCRENADIL